ncbi:MULTISPECIES: DUF2510 domain-containing protein [Aeromicrobium]|uniref:DUF2510 domain-containing protein n=1 Tax=Aeromicrobium TaxID=2040 RepID=UPI00257A11A5|nr:MULTISPECIES: DUF2510 domain-containing protein [Aeromicrobium]
MTEGPRASAGWYPDAQGELRYWDGAAWTEHTARNYQYAPVGDQPSAGGARGLPEARASRPWIRRWEFWLVAACVAFAGMTAIGVAATPVETDVATTPPTQATEPAPAVEQTTPSAEPTSTPDTEPTEEPVVLLFVTDQKDGDSWVASDGKEYRLGLVNTPERNEQCGPEATAYTRKFLSNGFTVDAYTTDDHGRAVAEVRDEKGRSLNVKLAKNGLGDGRYLEQFRHENPELARRLDRALAAASVPACRKAAKPVPLVPQPRKKEVPKSECMSGYSPCLRIVADLDCGEIGHPVKVTGSDPYRLDADGDGIGCD